MNTSENQNLLGGGKIVPIKLIAEVCECDGIAQMLNSAKNKNKNKNS